MSYQDPYDREYIARCKRDPQYANLWQDIVKHSPTTIPTREFVCRRFFERMGGQQHRHPMLVELLYIYGDCIE